MSGLRAASHAQDVLINRLATPLGGVLILVLIGRHSDQLLGEYALVTTYYYIMQMLPLLGLTPFVMREVARAPERAAEFFSTIGLLSILGCLLVDGVCYLLLGSLDYDPRVKCAILVTGVLIIPGILLFIAELLFMSMHQARPVAVVAVLENLARVVISAATLWAGGGLVGLVCVFLATRLCALVVYLVVMKRMNIVTRFELPNPALLRQTLGVIPAFFTGTVLFAIFYRLDFIVISLFEPVEQIGYYAIAYRLFEISIIVLTALIMALFPSVSRKFVGAQLHFRVAVKSMVLSFFFGLALICFGGVLLADVYVGVLFSRQYPEPVLLTQMFMAALLLAGMDFVASGVLHASDQQALDTRAMAFGGTVIVLLLLLLVPSVGILGAFVAKVVASLVQGGFKYYGIEQRLGPFFALADVVRLVLMVVVVTVAAVLLVDATLLTRLSAIFLMAGVVLPLMSLLLGFWQPLRLLRFYWHARGAGDVASPIALIDVMVADLRASVRRRRRQAMHGRYRHDEIASADLRCVALLLARVARFLHLRRHRRSAAVIGRSSAWLARCAGVPKAAIRARASHEPPTWA